MTSAQFCKYLFDIDTMPKRGVFELLWHLIVVHSLFSAFYDCSISEHTKNFAIIFWFVPTYLHFRCNRLYNSILYHVGNLHFFDITYINTAFNTSKTALTNTYSLYIKLFRLTFRKRNFLFLWGNKLFHKGNNSF